MPDKIHVLTVDDNEVNIRLIYKGLIGDYDVDTAESGSVALQKLEESDYDIVLLDVNMPEMNGYQVCEKIRDGVRNNSVPVIFISALTSLDDKLKGYAAGGNDYIDKPVMLDELKQKVELAVTQTKQLEALDQQVKFATKTAMTAMTNNSELGIIVTFMESSFQSEDVNVLLQTLVKAVSQYQIACCAQIRMDRAIINGCSSGIQVSKLEKDLLAKGRHADRIVVLGQRGFFNSPRVSLLIRNLPTDDKEKTGRLVDHLAAIVVAADARCKQIEIQEQELGNRNKTLDNVVDIADEEIEKIQDQFVHFQNETTRIMSELHTDIEESLFELHLSNNQEDRLYRLLEQGKKEMSDLSDWGVVVEDSLSKIKTTVTDAILKMN